MAVYEYKGLNEAGKAVTGMKEADSPKGLRGVLRKDGIFLTDVLGQAEAGGRVASGRKVKGAVGAANAALNKDVNLRRFAGGRVSTDDIAIMTRQLATLLGAGVTLVEALAALVDQVEKEKLKRVLSETKQKVNEGSSLGDA